MLGKARSHQAGESACLPAAAARCNILSCRTDEADWTAEASCCFSSSQCRQTVSVSPAQGEVEEEHGTQWRKAKWGREKMGKKDGKRERRDGRGVFLCQGLLHSNPTDTELLGGGGPGGESEGEEGEPFDLSLGISLSSGNAAAAAWECGVYFRHRSCLLCQLTSVARLEAVSVTTLTCGGGRK